MLKEYHQKIPVIIQKIFNTMDNLFNSSAFKDFLIPTDAIKMW